MLGKQQADKNPYRDESIWPSPWLWPSLARDFVRNDLNVTSCAGRTPVVVFDCTGPLKFEGGLGLTLDLMCYLRLASIKFWPLSENTSAQSSRPCNWIKTTLLLRGATIQAPPSPSCHVLVSVEPVETGGLQGTLGDAFRLSYPCQPPGYASAHSACPRDSGGVRRRRQACPTHIR